MPIPASPAPLRAAGEGFQPRDLAGLALLCARSWGVPRAAVMERLERTDWEEAEHRLSQRRPVSLDLGTVDLLASRTFRSGLGASSPNPGSPVPGRLLCGVRPLGDGRMEAAMAACLDTRNTETAGPSRSRRAGPRAFSGLPCTEGWIWISDP